MSSTGLPFWGIRTTPFVLFANVKITVLQTTPNPLIGKINTGGKEPVRKPWNFLGERSSTEIKIISAEYPICYRRKLPLPQMWFCLIDTIL